MVKAAGTGGILRWIITRLSSYRGPKAGILQCTCALPARAMRLSLLLVQPRMALQSQHRAPTPARVHPMLPHRRTLLFRAHLWRVLMTLLWLQKQDISPMQFLERGWDGFW